MGEAGIGEHAQGNEVLQALDRPAPRLFQTEDLLDILIEHEIELSVYKRQCIARRIPTLERLKEMTQEWNENRNSRQRKVDWQFRAEDARVKLKRLYPKL